jgi:EpsG family
MALLKLDTLPINSIVDTRVLALKQIDYLYLLMVGLLSFLAFIYAGEDFSYDYIHYLNYFEVLAEMEFNDLVQSIIDQFPFPYVYLPPTGLFEFGFAILAWLIMKLFGSASLGYAVIGSSSIVMRTWLLRKMGVPWIWLLLISVYGITLFEANAIRLGCAFTLFLLGVMFALQRKSAASILLTFLLASLFHLQILFEVFFFLVAFFFGKLMFGTQIRLTISILLSVSLGVSTVAIIEQLGLVKFDDYAGVISLAGGINIVSTLGILIWLTTCWYLIRIPSYIYYEKISHLDIRVWISIVLAGIPALVLFVSVTSMGAITDRFWQVAFMTLVSISFAKSWRHRIRWHQMFLLSALVLVASVNVIFRYPLSNFFYPLVPYTVIKPSIFF